MRTISVLLAAFLLSSWSVAAIACTGDCDDGGGVTATEIGVAVEIALGRVSSGDCQAGYGSGPITVDALVAGVGNLLRGSCPPISATPTSTSTPSASRTSTGSPTPTVGLTPAIEPVFPADYRATFIEVRDCRLSIEHGDGGGEIHVRVLANPIAAQDYLEEADPLPLGSIVVKEEFAGTTCDDAGLIRWRAMRKEAPGFDPQDGDWHWQWVNQDRSVFLDDKSTCIGCHIRPACKARDYMCTEQTDTLHPVLANLPAALLSVSGTGPTNMLAVGADPASDLLGPLVMHYNGSTWRRLDTRATGDLWWISIEPIGGSFYLAGEGGLVLKVDATTLEITRLETPTAALLYGIWGTAANDLWAVGGISGGDESGGGVVLHYDGMTWTLQDLTGVVPAGLPVLFKVWGRSTDDVFAAGSLGTIIHYDGFSWTQVQTDSMRPLFTVQGNATDVFAVGGFIDGVILERQEDTTFAAVTAAGLPQMNGVFAPASGLPTAVGRELSMARRTAAGWQLRQRSEGSIFDFHATWIDPEGGIWAVGGDLAELEKGLLQYAGPRTINSTIDQPPRCPTGATGGGTISYATDIEPLLRQTHCLDLGCHGGAFPSSGYDQRTYASSFRQGVEAKFLDVCPLVPGDPDASFFLEKLLPSPRPSGSQRMPNGFAPLTEAQVDLVRAWITEGARDN